MLISFMWMSYLGIAQDNVVNESFIIKKDRQLSLPVAERSFYPGYLPEVSSTHQPQIKFDSVRFERIIRFDLPATTPILINLPRQTNTYYNHFLELEGGSLWHSQLRYQYLKSIDQNKNVKVNFSHQGYGRGAVRQEESAENIQGLQIRANWIGKNSFFDWNINTNRHQFHYYGVPDSLVDEQLISSNTKLGLSNKLRVITHKGPVHSTVSFGHRLTNYEAFLMKEHLISGLATINFQLSNLIAFYQKLDWNYSNFQSSNSSDRSVYSSQTNFEYKLNQWEISAGFNLIGVDSVSSVGNRLSVLPDIGINFKLANSRTLSIGLKSHYEVQSLAELSSRNIYLSDSLTIRTALYKNNWSINYQAIVKDRHQFNAGLSYATVENKLFLVSDENESTGQFKSRYDSSQIGRLALDIGVSGRFSEKVSYKLSADYQQFYLDTLSKAYHEPSLKLNSQVYYHLTNQLSFSGTINWWQEMNYSLKDNSTEEKDSIIDLGLAFKWTVSQKLTTNIEFSNLLNQSNSRYYLYRSRPVQVKAGVFLRF
jgi:hypothetical protein